MANHPQMVVENTKVENISLILKHKTVFLIILCLLQVVVAIIALVSLTKNLIDLKTEH